MLPPIVNETLNKTTSPLEMPLQRGGMLHLTVNIDPMHAGFEAFRDSFETGNIINLLVTKGAMLNWTLAMATKDDVETLFKTWCEVAGFDKDSLSVLFYSIKTLDLLEVDFQAFYSLDLREWFKKDSKLTSRRVVNLILGMRYRPDSLFWSSFTDYEPMSKEEILLGEIASMLKGEQHQMFTTKSERERKAEQEKQRKEAMERIAARNKLLATQ